MPNEIDDLADDVLGDLITDDVEFPDYGDQPPRRHRPEHVNARVAVLESSDLDVRTCQHEITYALAALSGVDVATTEPPVEFENIARKLRDLIRVYPKCKLKGAS